jgi:hypothetical protein
MYTINIDQETVNEYFIYSNGELLWKKNVRSDLIGKPAGCVKAKGYRYVGLNNKHYRVHRLIFLMFRGYMPECIDHINDDRLDNRIENLAETTNSKNLLKIPIRRISVSGEIKWLARKPAKFDYENIGLFNTKEEAEEARSKFQ